MELDTTKFEKRPGNTQLDEMSFRQVLAWHFVKRQRSGCGFIKYRVVCTGRKACGSPHLECSKLCRIHSPLSPPVPVLLCRVDKSSGRVTYQLQDGNGIPFLPHGGMNCPVPCIMGTVPVGMGNAPAGQGTAPIGGPGNIVPAGAVVPVVDLSMGTVTIVGGKCKEDKWSEYTDDNGRKYYHNPAKNETTWKKPKDFDKKKKEGKPPPPPDTEKKEKKKSPKYIVKPGWI